MRGDRARKSFRERGQDAPAVTASALWKRLRQQGGVSGLEGHAWHTGFRPAIQMRMLRGGRCC